MKNILCTKDGKIRQTVRDACLIDALQGTKVYLFHSRGKGKHTHYSAESPLRRLLDELGIRYELMNDSPRGGLLWQYIHCPINRQPKTKQKILEILKEEMK